MEVVNGSLEVTLDNNDSREDNRSFATVEGSQSSRRPLVRVRVME
jgi:hypothetical protein